MRTPFEEGLYEVFREFFGVTFTDRAFCSALREPETVLGEGEIPLSITLDQSDKLFYSILPRVEDGRLLTTDKSPLIAIIGELWWAYIESKYNLLGGSLGIRKGWILVRIPQPKLPSFADFLKEMGGVVIPLGGGKVGGEGETLKS
jgi:hypothetical protein